MRPRAHNLKGHGAQSHPAPKRKNSVHQMVFRVLLVAEMGFEPHDLRVMSPTSCQTAPLRDIIWCRKPGSNRYEKKSHGILSPGRLPIPPFRHARPCVPYTLLNYYITSYIKCQPLFKKKSKKFSKNIDIHIKMWYHIEVLTHLLYAFNRTLFVCFEQIKYMQEYFAIRRRCSPRRVCETQISKNTQAYRSGHNEAVLKTVRGNSHGGSNPSACAKKHQLFGWCFSIFCIKFVCGHNG